MIDFLVPDRSIIVPGKPTLNPVLRDFWTARGVRNRVLEGGRASSKTWDAGGMAVFLAHNYKVKFLCTRQFQNRIEDSVYSLLKIQIERFQLQKHFAIYQNRIECPATGSEFLFYGRVRNITEIKGTEDVDIHWGEECELLQKHEWDTIDGTIRKEGSQHWLIFNPQFASDFVYKRFVTNPPPRTLHRKINYNENPFLSNTMLEVIRASYDEDQDDYQHLYLGVPKGDDDRVLIKRKWIEAAIDAHLKLGFVAQGNHNVGFDVADDGEDKCAMIEAHGSVAQHAEEWKAGEDELLQSCTRVYDYAWTNRAAVTYDSIGIGAYCGAKLNELNANPSRYKFGVRHTGFNAGGAVRDPDHEYTPGRTNADMFSNVKAQRWWQVADRFRNTYNAVTRGAVFPPEQLISISGSMPHLAKLKDELSTPRRHFDENGRNKVESKKDLARRHVASPNLADAFIMAFDHTPGFDLSALT